MLGLNTLELDANVIEPLTPEQIKALVVACTGKDLRDPRDGHRPPDRYLRTRRSDLLAGTPELWLGDRGEAFSYDALHK